MILDEIVADKKKRLAEQKKRRPLEALKEEILSMEAPAGKPKAGEGGAFYRALSREGLSLIGEFKQASPSLGTIAARVPLPERIRQYTETVDAISCLTEEDHFHGSAGDFTAVKVMTPLPVLRKDFIIDEYQIFESRRLGADAILLIAAILEEERLEAFYRLAGELGLDVLLEVHEEEELFRAKRLGAGIIGVNNRNLKDFTIDLTTTKRLFQTLLNSLGEGERRPVLVSESGISDIEQVRFLRKCGADALLVGRALMEAKEPAGLAREWKKEG